jgi:hypothetical protein
MTQDEKFEDKYLDVLQNIEFGIVGVYEQHPELTDWDASEAIQALIRHYAAEARGRSEPHIRLTDLGEEVYDSVATMCEFRLGRTEPSTQEGEPLDQNIEPKSLDEIIACLKRIHKSIRRWHKEAGRRGYLDFVSQFVQ